jgi:hypothetical protein
MKKVIVERVREEAKFFCDKHPDRECYTRVQTSCWYGSVFDMYHIKVNLCDECMTKFYDFIKENFGVEPFEDDFGTVMTRRCCCEND